MERTLVIGVLVLIGMLIAALFPVIAVAAVAIGIVFMFLVFR